MKGTNWMKCSITYCVVVGAMLFDPVARAELKPGEVLDQATWQEAKEMMPEAILRRFASGQHLSKVITLPPEALQYGSRFRQLTEENLGKYDVNEHGVLIETSTGTWPRYRVGGFPFPVMDQNDPKAAYKVIYNFASRGGPVDDIDLLLNIFWVDSKNLNRSVDFKVHILSHGSRWSGPIPNPDETAVKGLGYGIAPYDVVGIATLSWGYLDPDKWDSRWAYIPVIRRVRRLAASNASDGFLGSHWSPTDYGLFAGRIQYFTWKLIGSREALVPTRCRRRSIGRRANEDWCSPPMRMQRSCPGQGTTRGSLPAGSSGLGQRGGQSICKLLSGQSGFWRSRRKTPTSPTDDRFSGSIKTSIVPITRKCMTEPGSTGRRFC